MLLTIKKQVDETLEMKTPAYYNDYLGNPAYVNDAGELIIVRNAMLLVWYPKNGDVYHKQIAELVTNGKPSTREQFETAYRTTLDNIQAAVDGVVINS